MAMVLGHSQAKYLSEYLPLDSYSVFSYPGFKTQQFLIQDELFDVAPYFSVIVIVVGANDIRSKPPAEIVADIETLCAKLRKESPSARLLVSEVLPRSQNRFQGGNKPSKTFLELWNHDAEEVNKDLHLLAKTISWVTVIKHPEFRTLLRPKRQLLSTDGLHLSFHGTRTFAKNIESAVRALQSGSTKNCTRSKCPSLQEFQTRVTPSSETTTVRHQWARVKRTAA